ncbi:MAG: DUF3108 domain-containing protein [Methylotenera sp.]|nr:DUF3108 domain-containing protein [Methylotenera sp.]MDO9233544.1 DUF3108 domain-containing protein [Methylotenera sp.]MDP2103117.1 DUF3108 domain-containing protein [Methylotenera sp.]MDP2280076.1 DUF3108 domain-containing protein [Methylotenera sp.]MDP2403592.1 DUF3108 domain-containing protein [Methylotenera sp.]
MQLPHNIANMLNRLKVHFSQNKILLLATLISLLSHTFLLTKFLLTLSEIEESYQILEMRLVNLEPTQKITPVPIKQSTATPEQIPVVYKEAAVTDPEVEEGADALSLDEAPTSTEDPAVEPPSITALKIEQSLESTTTALLPTEIIKDTDTTELGDIASKPALQAYQYAETEFEVRRGGDASVAGFTRVIFNIDKNGTYSISSNTQAKGLASLFLGTLIQKSEGTVTSNGLVPSFYLYQYGADENKTQTARFVWSDNALQMHSAKGDKTEMLVAGTQDFLSFMYQFMFLPPLENMQIMMTNGKNLRTYIYSFEGEEIIYTKLGELKTVHLLRSGSEEEKTELWLALDYQYLPVKIRKTEKDGSIIEQIATNIYKTSP